ncbi:MAG: helix-turn-helix transcriptional regulator [Bradymonadia bacterium]
MSQDDASKTKAQDRPSGWTFLTNHAHVLLCLAKDPEVRLRDVAVSVGVTERAVQRIVHDLHEGGYIEIIKEGRRNRYTVHRQRHLRHPIECHRRVQSLVELVEGQD